MGTVPGPYARSFCKDILGAILPRWQPALATWRVQRSICGRRIHLSHGEVSLFDLSLSPKGPGLVPSMASNPELLFLGLCEVRIES